MNKWIWVLIVCTLYSCEHKKANLSGSMPVKINDFIVAFPPINFPFNSSDSNINENADTTTISKSVISQFIPDTVLNSLVNSNNKFLVHPVGRIEKEKEIYLVFNIVQKKQIQQVIAVFKKSNTFLAAKLLINNTAYLEDGYRHSVNINKEPTFLISKERINAQTKQIQLFREAWVYNSAGIFMVVLNDTNEDPKKIDEIINPIDTLPRKNKLSGEYGERNRESSRSFLSIRDGKAKNSYLFFIHFEKKDGACIGELKGIIQMKDEQHGVYSQGGDPCAIDFLIEGNSINVKEKGSCGNRRGMECLFDDTFTKKKEPKKDKHKTSNKS